MKLKGTETERKERTKIGVVKLIDAGGNFMWGVDTKKYWHKIWLPRLWRSGPKIAEIAPLCCIFFLSFKSSKRYLRGIHHRWSVTFITFNLIHDICLTVELIAFVFRPLREDKLFPEEERVEKLAVYWILKYSQSDKYCGTSSFSAESARYLSAIKRQRIIPAKSHRKCQTDKTAAIQRERLTDSVIRLNAGMWF